MTWPLRFRLSHLFNGNSITSLPTGVWPSLLPWGIHHGSCHFRQRAPQVLPGGRPESGELGSLWSRKTAMPRETPACQRRLGPAEPCTRWGKEDRESQVMSPIQTPLPVPSVSWCPGERGVIVCPSSPSLPALTLAFPDKGEEKPTAAGGGPHPFMLTLEPPSHPFSLLPSSHVGAPQRPWESHLVAWISSATKTTQVGLCPCFPSSQQPPCESAWNRSGKMGPACDYYWNVFNMTAIGNEENRCQWY